MNSLSDLQLSFLCVRENRAMEENPYIYMYPLGLSPIIFHHPFERDLRSVRTPMSSADHSRATSVRAGITCVRMQSHLGFLAGKAEEVRLNEDDVHSTVRLPGFLA